MNLTTDFRDGTIALIRRETNPETHQRPHATMGMRTPFGWQIAWADEYGNGGSMLVRDTDSTITDVVPLDITVTFHELGQVGIAWPEELGCPSIKNPPEGGCA
jgi:hypothetical protein